MRIHDQTLIDKLDGPYGAEAWAALCRKYAPAAKSATRQVGLPAERWSEVLVEAVADSILMPRRAGRDLSMCISWIARDRARHLADLHQPATVPTRVRIRAANPDSTGITHATRIAVRDMRRVPLDDQVSNITASDSMPDSATPNALDSLLCEVFLSVMSPSQAQVCRYWSGMMTGQAMDDGLVADTLDISVKSATRLRQRGIAAARQLLAAIETGETR